MKALLVRALDLSTEVIEATQDTLYDVMSKCVGGYVDHATLRSKGMDFWVHDEGLIRGMQLNAWATYLASHEFRCEYPLAGDVFITGLADRSGSSQGLSDELIVKIQNSVAEFKRYYERVTP